MTSRFRVEINAATIGVALLVLSQVAAAQTKLAANAAKSRTQPRAAAVTRRGCPSTAQSAG